jgi:hypothetical protein
MFKRFIIPLTLIPFQHYYNFKKSNKSYCSNKEEDIFDRLKYVNKNFGGNVNKIRLLKYSENDRKIVASDLIKVI